MDCFKYFFKCSHIFINCVFKENFLEFGYLENFPKNDKFHPLCHLELDVISNIEIFDSNSGNNFQFLLICSNNSLENSLESEFFDLLFHSPEKIDKVVIISPADGYVYWCPIFSFNRANFPTKLNNCILFNTDAKAILIETFKHSLDNPLDLLITANSKSGKFKKNHNCLLVVTKHGKIFIYLYQSKIVYKVSILAHCLNFCLKFKFSKKEYLIYCTDLNEIYAVLLQDAINNPSPKSSFLTKSKSIINLKSILTYKKKIFFYNFIKRG